VPEWGTAARRDRARRRRHARRRISAQLSHHSLLPVPTG
jgi:hypothetical protein